MSDNFCDYNLPNILGKFQNHQLCYPHQNQSFYMSLEFYFFAKTRLFFALSSSQMFSDIFVISISVIFLRSFCDLEKIGHFVTPSIQSNRSFNCRLNFRSLNCYFCWEIMKMIISGNSRIFYESIPSKNSSLFPFL